MNGDELRAIQAPLKERYRGDAEAGLVTLKANGALDSEAASPARSRRDARLPSPGFIRRPGEAAPSSAPATCCSRRWLLAPA